MVLTAKQQKGLEIAVARYKEGKRWTCVSGYALQGKIRKYTYNFHYN